MKKVLLSFLAFFVAASTYATTFSTNIVGASTNLQVVSPMIISQILLVNSGTQTVTVGIFDNNKQEITRSNNVYTNWVMTVGSYTNIYTNTYITGTLYVTNIYNVLSNVATTVAAATNALNPLVILSVPTNNSVTFTPSVPITATFGLVTTNKDDITLSVTYLRTF